MGKKRLPLPKRFNAGMTEEAYARLRALNADYGLGNNYLLTVLLENLDDYANQRKLKKAFTDFIAEYCPPEEQSKPAPKAKKTPAKPRKPKT